MHTKALIVSGTGNGIRSGARSRRWVDFSRAKDVTLSCTDTQLSPWWVVEVDDKKRARLNTISHLLSSIPYEYEPKPPLELPERQTNLDYVRPPRETQRYVPEIY